MDQVKMNPGKKPGLRINWTSMFFLCVGGGMLLYFVYTALPPMRSYHVHSNLTWRKHTHYTVPSQIRQQMKDAETTEKKVLFNNEGESSIVTYLEASLPSKKENLLTVVFLHGMGDSSLNWKNIDSLNLVAAMGMKAVAVDLPKHGKTTATVPKNRGEFLTKLFEQLKIVKPVIVAASMGGSYALPYIMDDRPTTCYKRVTGFVPIAITSTDKYKPAQYNHCEIPTMIVYGVNDTHLGLHSVGDLRNLKNREIITIEKAGHACHHEKPEEWNLHLYNFLKHIQDDTPL